MSKTYDVIIAGAGPIGLFLACELALANVSVLVLERDPNPTSPFKSAPLGLRGLNVASGDALRRRGLLDDIIHPIEGRDRFIDQKPGFSFGGHFAGLLLNANKFDAERWPYRVPGQPMMFGGTTMEKAEAALARRAESLGLGGKVTIVRGKTVNGVAQDDDGVTVTVEGDETFRGRWLVGCDGGRSAVRRAAGFEFVGSDPEVTGFVIRADVDHPERLGRGFQPSKGGMFINGFGGVIYLVDFDGGASHRRDREEAITKDKMQDVLERVTGVRDVRITALHHASTFTDRAMMASTYRKARVLLAGDAAHIHAPFGAQGLNLGLGDAMNLGWKLAATIHSQTGKDDMTLLDTYEAERAPLAAGVLEWSRMQVATLQPTLAGKALQKLMAELIETVDGTNYFMSRIWGLAQRYDLGEGAEHDAVGRSAPDFEFEDGETLSAKLVGGRGLLLDFAGDEALKELAVTYEGKVDYLATGAKEQLGLRALLIRPDGIVAWVSEDEKADLEAAEIAFKKWFVLGS